MSPSAVYPETTSTSSSKSATPHPLAPLSSGEIQNTAQILRTQWPEGTDLQFKSITLSEPSKAALAPYLQAENQGLVVPPLDRRAYVSYYLRKTVRHMSFSCAVIVLRPSARPYASLVSCSQSRLQRMPACSKQELRPASIL